MNEKNRVFGNNVKLFISDKNLSEQTVAEHLGYSKYDLWKIMDGRLFLDEDEKRDIAEELQTTVEDLYMPRSEEKYHAAGCIECRGEFSHADTKAYILDLLDVYVNCCFKSSSHKYLSSEINISFCLFGFSPLILEYL